MSKKRVAPHNSSAKQASPAADDGRERLQKVLASAGLGSRRQCEDLILTGRVDVDRRVVTELGTKANPSEQEIRVDGVPLAKPRLVYFMVNKPPGVLSTNRDPSGRPRVIDLVPSTERLFTVGRLDMSSEGLILVTNDGELANRLTHPRYGVEKTYHVEVAGLLDRHQLSRLREGVHLAEGFARVVSAKIVRQYKQSTMLEIVLAEGRNREIRRILARVGHKVERLKRVAMGPLRLGELPSGHVVQLTRDEVRRLKQAAHGEVTKRPRAPRKQAAAARAPAKATMMGRVVIGAGPTKVVTKSAGPRPKPAARPKGAFRPKAGDRPQGAGRPRPAKGKPGRAVAQRRKSSSRPTRPRD